MPEFILLVLLFIISYLGYWLFELIRFPASRIVGPIIVVALIQMFGITFSSPVFLKMLFSSIFGVYLGLRFDQTALKQLKVSIIPAAFLSIIYIGITILYGKILMQVSSMDHNTAFLSVIPGGVAEAGVLAVSFGANLSQVSSFQLVRYLSIVMIMPLISKYIISPIVKRSGESNKPVETSLPQLDESSLNSIHYSALWLFVVGAIGSFLFYKIHFPAALLLGATFFVALTQLISPRPFKRPPEFLYSYAQIGMGAIIGTSFTRENFSAVAGLVVPMLLLTFMIVTTSVILGFIFSKIFKMDYMTGLMSVLPGGLSTMVILAEAFDVDIVTISTLQLARLLTAVAVIPILYQWIL